MRFEITYPEEIWSVMPDPGAEADDLWIAEQRTAYARGPLAAYDEILEGAAREALGRRRLGVDTSLFFRPLDLPMTGVLHATLQTAPPGIEADPLEWMLPGVDLLLDPAISQFQTDDVPLGYRIAYVTSETFEDGSPMAGIAYGLLVDDLLGLVFCELARTDVAGAMQIHADPVVGSLRIVA